MSVRFPMSRMRIEGGRIIAGVTNSGWRARASIACAVILWLAHYLEKRLSPELRDNVLGFHLRSGSAVRAGLNDGNSRILSRDGVFVALNRANLHTLSGDAVLLAVRDGFEDDVPTMEVENLHIEDEAFQLDIVSPSVSSDVGGAM